MTEGFVYIVMYGYTYGMQCREFFDTLDEANAFALNEWKRLSDKEKEERYCYVGRISADALDRYFTQCFEQCYFCEDYFNSKTYKQQKDLILTKGIQC